MTMSNNSFSFSMNSSMTKSSLIIIFEIIRYLTSFVSIVGILGNIALIFIIVKTSFRHVSYGLLIVLIALFDCFRLLSGIYYYLLFGQVIRMNSLNQMIYLTLDRYPVFVVNWCKVLMSIERLLTVRYWEHHTHLDWRSKHKRKQYRHFTITICLLLFFGILIEHPNYLTKRYRSVEINYQYLMIENEINENYFYFSFHFNEKLFQIVSNLIFETTMPILSLLVSNLFLFREIQKLPLSLQIKVKESIGILVFLTILSITMIPRVFLSFYFHSALHQHSNENFYQILSLFYICLGFEYVNHAITGYACFLSSTLLRSELKNLLWNKFISHHLQ